MTRVKRGNVARVHRKKILKRAKGFKGSHSKLFRVANQQVMKALKYSYIGRKQKKREFRRLWIIRINIASRNLGISYNLVIRLLKNANISLDRKMLAFLALTEPKIFEEIVQFVGGIEKPSLLTK